MKQVFNIISTEIIVVKCNSKKLFFVKQQEVKIYVVNEFDIKYEFKQQKFLLYKTQKEFNERYYNEILNFIKKYKDYSILGHLDVIRRYDKTYYPFEKVKDIIAEILKIVIADGKGIEVNTSSFRYKIPDFMPSENILKLYKDLGGEIITVGSDSHDILHLGSNFDKAREELIKLGYKHFYTFDKMKPIVHDLKDGV